MDEETYETRELFGKTVRVQIPSDAFPTDEQIANLDTVTGPNCKHGWYDSVTKNEDGSLANLHYRYWVPSDQPLKGIVVFNMGILSETSHAARVKGESMERPLDVALLVDTFAAKGIALYARDQYGHGLSEGTRFYVPRWEDAKMDVINFVKLVAGKHPANIPLFVSGESFGGCLALLASKHFQDHPDEAPSNFDSTLLICPAIDGDLPPLPVYLLLRYVLAPMFPTKTPFFMPETVGPERLYRDPEVLKYYQEKETFRLDNVGVPFRLGTAVGLLGAMEDLKNGIPDLSVPFCVVHGDKDEGVPISGSEFLFEKSATPSGDKVFRRLEGALHAVLSDPSAEEAMEHIVKFVDERLEKFVSK